MKNSEKTCFFFFFVEFKKTREYSSRSLNLANFSIFVGRIWILKRGGDFDIFFFSKGRWGEASPFSIFFASTSPLQNPSFALITRFVIRQPVILSHSRRIKLLFLLDPRKNFTFPDFCSPARWNSFLSGRESDPDPLVPPSFRSLDSFSPSPFDPFLNSNDLNRSLNFLIEILSFIRYPFAYSWMMNKGIKGKLVFLKLFFLFLHAWKLMIQREGRRGMKIALIREKSVWTEWRETVVARSGSQNKSNLPFH